jgi:hypothetical protein
MRSKLVLCAALAGTFVLGTWSVAHAADPKAKKGKSGDSSDSAINKQMQWEESVMGPDDKRAELDKIARAQAINKAAAEKAAKEKEKADAQAAKDAAKEAAQPKTTKRGGEVALPKLDDEDSSKGSKGKTSEISPKLETAAAAAPPPPVKHGDDKFIDKLLTNDGGSKKKKASAEDDKALNDLLAVEKPKAGPAKKGKKDDVDSLLLSADKAPPMPEKPVKHETPEWAKPEISTARVESPLAARPAPKRDDGIIHVVQGAAAPTPAASHPVTPARRTAVATPTPARTSVATRSPAARRQSDSDSWDDPFSARPKKTVAAREAHHSDSGADDLDDVAPVQRTPPARHPASDDGNAKTAGTRRAAPAAKPKWKDPFTESEGAAPARPTTVATREPRKSESSKWDVAEHHEAPAAAQPPKGHSGRWGVLKKH